MLSEVREWLAEKALVEYDGHSGSSVEVAKTDTSLAGFLLKAAIENLYADRLIDMLITEAAAIWSKENMVNEFGEVEPIDADCVRMLLKQVSEVAAGGLPPESALVPCRRHQLRPSRGSGHPAVPCRVQRTHRQLQGH